MDNKLIEIIEYLKQEGYQVNREMIGDNPDDAVLMIRKSDAG